MINSWFIVLSEKNKSRVTKKKSVEELNLHPSSLFHWLVKKKIYMVIMIITQEIFER